MKNNIPIFDTLTHPTLNGQWILPKYPDCAYIEDLKIAMHNHNIKGTFAVGMNGIGDYEEDKYLAMIKESDIHNILPIAFFNMQKMKTNNDVDVYLKSVKQKGYVGIKLHPRIGNFMLNNELLPYVIDKANEYGLVVLLCTYFYCNQQSKSVNNIESLSDLLLKISSNSNIVLLHGGSVRLLETMEIVRAFPNTLLDLSLTFCKYAGSSLDMDIQFMFQQFDRRICIGSDHPEISLSQLRERFNYFASKTTIEKAENIAYRNIENFIN